MDKIIDKIKNTRILAIIGIVLLILGTFLPFIKVSILGYSRTISLTGYWEGYVIMALAVLHVATLFDDWVESFLPKLYDNKIFKLFKENKKLSIVPTILVVLFLLITIFSLDLNSSYSHYSIGFYTICLGCVALVAYPFIHKKSEIAPTEEKSVETTTETNTDANTDTNSETNA